MKPGLIGALTGLAEAFAVVKRLTRDEALAEIRDELATVPENDRKTALNEAAAGYVDRPYPWQADALALLIEAGADREAAAAIRARRAGGRGLGGLGEQAPGR